MKKIVLIMSVVVLATLVTSCDGGNDTRQNMINAQDAYLADKNLDDQLAEKAVEVVRRSGKWCVTPKPEIPCPTCGDQSQQVAQQQTVQEAVPATTVVPVYVLVKEEVKVKTVTRYKTKTRIAEKPCIPCSKTPDSVSATLNTVCIDGEKYVISADQNIPQQAFGNYRFLNGVIYQKVSSLK